MSINVGGASNCWAAARWATKHRPPVVVVQEVCMNTAKQADLADFMLRNGYRSWFACPPTHGGVGIFVRFDKSAHLLRTHTRAEGQAVMLQLDHAILIGAYLAPNSAACDIASTLDEWVGATGEHTPLVIVGDFNEEPCFGERWNHISGFGGTCAVCNQNGVPQPTRWSGTRCIDWIWASHLLTIDKVRFEDVWFFDHKPVCFSLQYSQSHVWSFKAVQTRKWTAPPNVSLQEWKNALKTPWSEVTVPPVSNTNQEWSDFCHIAERAHLSALETCGATVPRPSRSRNKGSEFQVEAANARTFRIAQQATFKELRLRKLLGRIAEAQNQQSRGRQPPAILIRRIFSHPFVVREGLQSLGEAREWAQQELRSHVQSTQTEQLQAWRERMRSSCKDAGRWVKKCNTLPVTSVYDDGYKQGKATSSDHESLKAVLSFWQKIWERDRPDPEEAVDFWKLGVPQPSPLAWTPLTAEELFSQASRLRGTAAGCDGWSGDEIAAWPKEAWVILVELLNRWFSRSEVPTVWKSIRQILLQKPNAKLRDTDHALPAKDLRPIAIQSVIWRAIASAWTRRPQTRAWVTSWVHSSACGGIQGKSVAHAVDRLLQDFEKRQGGVLLSLDFSKCFDTVDPRIGIKCLEYLGCPKEILFALTSVWSQERWLCFRRDCLPQPVQVDTSIPQGDAISPLTLLAVLTGLTGRVLQARPEPHTLVTFLDDRNMVAKTPELAARLWDTWKQLSPKVGLKENEEKIQIVARQAAFKPRLIAAGFDETHIVQGARVLGVDFTARLGAAHKPSQDARLQDARLRVERIGLLPVTASLKAFLVSSLAITKAAWGAWLKPLSAKPLSTCIRKTTGGSHIAGSPNLFYMLSGHRLNLNFAAGFGAYIHLAPIVRENPRRWPNAATRGTWLGTVRSWLQSLNWHEEAAWTWIHPDIQFRLDWTQPIDENTKQREHHALREAWRRQQFQQFLSSGRRDATAVQGSVYQEARAKLTRQTYQSSNTHSRACLIGAVVSDARLDRIRDPNTAPAPCKWCASGNVPTWDHLAWDCPAFAATRTSPLHDLLQRVLGWPTGRNEQVDAAILTHLGCVRERVLDRRYRSN